MKLRSRLDHRDEIPGMLFPRQEFVEKLNQSMPDKTLRIFVNRPSQIPATGIIAGSFQCLDNPSLLPTNIEWHLF